MFLSNENEVRMVSKSSEFVQFRSDSIQKVESQFGSRGGQLSRGERGENSFASVLSKEMQASDLWAKGGNEDSGVQLKASVGDSFSWSGEGVGIPENIMGFFDRLRMQASGESSEIVPDLVVGGDSSVSNEKSNKQQAKQASEGQGEGSVVRAQAMSSQSVVMTGTVTSKGEGGESFNLKVEASSQTSLELSVGGKTRIDPLIINFDGQDVEFSKEKFDFDLDADGDLEALPQFKNGAGFLAFDKNQNGIIDDGKELFGPQTGNGFDELEVYDENFDGVIDNQDSIFMQLSIWKNPGEKNDEGLDVLQSLSDAGIQNIGLLRILEERTIRDDSSDVVAFQKEKSSAKFAEGGVNSVQELDFLV